MPPTPPSASSSSSTTSTLTRPKSSSSIHPFPYHSRDTRRPSQPHPLMIALSGWPEAVYVSADRMEWERKRSSRAGTPPQVYDGVMMDTAKISTAKSHPSILSPISTAAPITTTAVVTPPAPFHHQEKQYPTSTNSNGQTKHHARAQSIPTPTAPTAAPPPSLSIFSTVCPHLLDPSLGPCPFQTHPHDIRGMFPPTSHLSKSPPNTRRGTQLPSSTSANGSGNGNGDGSGGGVDRREQQAVGRDGDEGESKCSPQEKDRMDMPPPPTPSSQGRPSSPNPLSQSQFMKQTYPSSSSSSSSSSNKSRSRRKGTFNDPRYMATSSILHKGRALPVVPSWTTSGSTSTPSSTATNGQSSPKPIIAVSSLMDIDQPTITTAPRARVHVPSTNAARFADITSSTPSPPPPSSPTTKVAVVARAEQVGRGGRDIRLGKGGYVLRATPEIYPPQLSTTPSNGTINKSSKLEISESTRDVSPQVGNDDEDVKMEED
ncbi:hypothetical protein CI109_106351 [Kwoniella shandongensis]|uniref:Uncharacterized protein n=1 Tax=Kwoniella shandongensis TaxID=1734106 RepID=A0A5M6BUA7_9TREE|nr:uncharacterized protein CI109_005944 [Kwoniella shandongensis]KAA5525781.1 hypothetical protein CI109_005944 [Kwoniella shandongensis]